VSHVTSIAEKVYSNNHAYNSLSSNIYNGKQLNCDLHLIEEYKYTQNIIPRELLRHLLKALCTRDISHSLRYLETLFQLYMFYLLEDTVSSVLGQTGESRNHVFLE